MSTHTIPVTGKTSNYEEITTLDGTDFVLRLLWNRRARRWFMSLRDADGNELATGRKLVAAIPWAAHDTIDGMPPGNLWIVDRNAADTDPGLRDLGDRVRLMYVDEDNVG